MGTVETYLFNDIARALLFVPKVLTEQEAATVVGKDKMVQDTTDIMRDAAVVRAKATEEVLREAAKAAIDFNDLNPGQMGMSGIMESAGETAKVTGGYNMIEVQYNPKSLSLRTTGGPNVTISAGMGNAAENQITQTNLEVETLLRCELVFTDVKIMDAFMMEGKTSLNLQTGVEIAKGLGKHSVQRQVDGFLSLLAQCYTRQVIFAWGQTVFRGELTSVSANYKMFNRKGNPIMATVGITIRQGSEVQYGYDEGYWRKMFEKVFKTV